MELLWLWERALQSYTDTVFNSSISWSYTDAYVQDLPQPITAFCKDIFRIIQLEETLSASVASEIAVSCAEALTFSRNFSFVLLFCCCWGFFVCVVLVGLVGWFSGKTRRLGLEMEKQKASNPATVLCYRI